MDLSAQVMTTQLGRGLVHLDGRAATLEVPSIMEDESTYVVVCTRIK